MANSRSVTDDWHMARLLGALTLTSLNGPVPPSSKMGCDGALSPGVGNTAFMQEHSVYSYIFTTSSCSKGLALISETTEIKYLYY